MPNGHWPPPVSHIISFSLYWTSITWSHISRISTLTLFLRVCVCLCLCLCLCLRAYTRLIPIGKGFTAQQQPGLVRTPVSVVIALTLLVIFFFIYYIFYFFLLSRTYTCSFSLNFTPATFLISTIPQNTCHICINWS